MCAFFQKKILPILGEFSCSIEGKPLAIPTASFAANPSHL
jgi:hypothetical protein